MAASPKLIGLQTPWLCAAIPAIVAVVSCGALSLVGNAGWPGEMGVTAMMFCERLRDTVVKQPANTWSNVGFVAVGLWIGVRAMRDRSALAGSDAAAPGQAPNRMASTNFYPGLYASLAVLLGPGSAAMHASTTAWGGRLDVISMFVWVAFCVAYALVRYFDLSTARFVGIYLALAVPLSGMVLVDYVPLGVDAFFGVLIVTMAGLEAAIVLRRPQLAGNRRWLVAAAVLFLVAFGVWLPSRTDGPWCAPDSLLQGHAVWHLLDSGAVACIFAFYRSERSRPQIGHTESSA